MSDTRASIRWSGPRRSAALAARSVAEDRSGCRVGATKKRRDLPVYASKQATCLPASFSWNVVKSTSVNAGRDGWHADDVRLQYGSAELTLRGNMLLDYDMHALTTSAMRRCRGGFETCALRRRCGEGVLLGAGSAPAS